jgi:hypothetical protein
MIIEIIEYRNLSLEGNLLLENPLAIDVIDTCLTNTSYRDVEKPLQSNTNYMKLTNFLVFFIYM